MLVLRRVWLGLAASRRRSAAALVGCWLACALPASGVLAQAGAAPAQPAQGSTSPAPVAPIAPVSETAPGAQPVRALQPTPTTPPEPAAGAAPPAAAPTAVPAAPPEDEKKDEEPSPSEPPEVPPPEPQPTTAAGAAASVSTDADITLVDSPTEGDEEKDELPWSASIDWGQSFNAAGLSRGGEQSYNPEYIWDFVLALGYKLDELTSLALRQPLTIELTDSDTTNNRQELWLLDTTLDATRDLWLYKPMPGDVLTLSGGVGLVFPVSPSSQAANLILGTRAKVGVEYTKKKIMHGLSFGTGFAYLRRWASSNQVSTDTPYACRTGSDDISDNCTHLGGLSTRRDVLKLDVHGELSPLEQLSINLSFSVGWNRGYDLSDGDVTTSTGSVVSLADEGTHWRNTREIVIGVGYAFTDWFSVSANATNGFRERGPDGELRGPFETVDTAFGLNLSLSIDQLYLAQRGRGTGGD